MIKFTPPTFRKTERTLRRLQQQTFMTTLHKIGLLGVSQLSSHTPVDTGETATSWDYEITSLRDGYNIVWTNSVTAGRAPLVVLIRYGHATGTGGYVSANNFITPALRGIQTILLDEIVKEIRL